MQSKNSKTKRQPVWFSSMQEESSTINSPSSLSKSTLVFHLKLAHVIAVMETWLNASVPDSCLTIPSFSVPIAYPCQFLLRISGWWQPPWRWSTPSCPRERQVPTQRRSTMLARKCLDWAKLGSAQEQKDTHQPSFWVVSTVHPQWRRVTLKTSLPCWNSHWRESTSQKIWLSFWGTSMLPLQHGHVALISTTLLASLCSRALALRYHESKAMCWLSHPHSTRWVPWVNSWLVFYEPATSRHPVR